jgi:hypothetical protein
VDRAAADRARDGARADGPRTRAGAQEHDRSGVPVPAPPAAATPPALAATPPAPGTPPVALEPPSPAGPSATSADAQIREVLGAYARAFETKDLDLLQQMRLRMTPAEVARHQSVFAQTRSYRIGLRIDRIVVRGNEAEARGEREDTIVTSSGDTIRHPPEDFRFALRRVGERWRIDRVR